MVTRDYGAESYFLSLYLAPTVLHILAYLLTDDFVNAIFPVVLQLPCLPSGCHILNKQYRALYFVVMVSLAPLSTFLFLL